jgi:hypothetical protein
MSRGPTHRYIGASPGCWAAYGRLSEREASDFRCMRHHQLTVDAYCAQHPGEPSPQLIRSVAVHLVGLHLQLERETATEGLYAARQRIASLGKEGKLNLAWLEPPASMGGVTVLRALEAEDPNGYGEVARVWAEGVWGRGPHTMRPYAVGPPASGSGSRPPYASTSENCVKRKSNF